MTRVPARPQPTTEPPAPAGETSAREIDALLSHAVEEAARLLNADGAMVYLVDPDDGRMHFAVDAGIGDPEAQRLIRDLSLPVGVGLFGHSVATRQVVVSPDYRHDARFAHSPVADRIVEIVNMRSMAAAPLVTGDHVAGALGAYSSRVDDFDEAEIALLRALADHAAAAISNRQLIERLAQSQDELARRVDAQRTLAKIAASIAGIRTVDEVLREVVEAARRLIGSDGAHLTLMEPGGTHLRPTVVAGDGDGRSDAWLRELRFPVNDGINGLAAGTGTVVWTHDYPADPRIPHEPSDQAVAERLGLRGMAAAPLRGPEGQVIGTLAVSFADTHAFGDDELELLGGLADQGAIAISNARLLDRLSSSEARFRHLVTSSPDLVWETDAEGRFTFLSPRLTELTGWSPEELSGQAWESIVDAASMEAAQATWAALQADPHTVRKIRFLLRRRGGQPISAEVYAIGSERDGAFAGAHGSIRDLTESEALTERLRRQTDELADRIEAQRTLAHMAAQLTSLRDPSDVLEETLMAAVRLLKGDGGQIGMIAPDADGTLRWGHGHSLVHGQLAPFTKQDSTKVDEGVSGRAVRERRATWTDDYLADPSFLHDPHADDVAREQTIRAVIAAPLLGEDGPIGAIGVYAETPAAFGAEDAELLGLLADQAAIVLTNARLNAEAEVTAQKLARRVEAQQALAAISTEIASLHDPAAVLQRSADEARRLLQADAAVINPLHADGTRLGLPIASSPADEPFNDVEVPVGGGVSGRAISERRVVRTGDYLADPSFEHVPEVDAHIGAIGVRSVMSAPLVSGASGLGTLSVEATRLDAFDESDEALLRTLADQAAIAITNARLYDELGAESAALARQTASQQRLLQITERLLRTLDPASVLELIADGLKSVVWYDNFSIYRVDDEMTVLRPVLARDRNATAVLEFPIPRGSGLTWWTVEHREPVLLNDALNDPRVIQIPGTAEEREAMIIVPLISGDEVIGAMNIARTGGDEVAFTDADFELVQLFAGQAAVAITNARLVEQLRARMDAQRSLAEIAAHIASLHEPQTVLDRAVADAARLLGADRAQINLVGEGGTHLDPPITAAPIPPSADDVPVPIGSGIAGIAAAEGRVCWTGDYLADAGFPHDEGDAWIEVQAIRSMMSAPLVGPDRLIGTITVQARSQNAFDEQDAELLKLLADQAAISLTNARLYAELEESERRYRHLVDNSPDIVWEVDADGRFTFFSDSLEERTGWKAEQLLGQRFTVLAGATTLAEATEAWRQLRAQPGRERRVRLDLPLPDGRVAKTEVAMTGTMVDGRFGGAHGSVRDISERERLEGDLRDQAAELAASQERAHLARELHDSVTQALFSMGLTLRAMELLLDTDSDGAREKLAELRELQKDALAEMRTLIFELRPSSLESDGLVQALRTHATAVQRRTGLAIVVDAEPIDRLPLAVEEALYRIGQEALHNVVKHANASGATIRIWQDAGRIGLSVVDDGTGFDPGAVPRGHLGLIGMRQRADLVGGELRVDSRPGRGTTVEASIELGRIAADAADGAVPSAQ